MAIEIQIRDDDFADEVIKSAPQGILIKRSVLRFRSADVAQAVLLTLTFIRDKSVDIDIALLATWLYEKSKHKACYVSKRGKKIPDTKFGVRRWIQEELDITDNHKSDNQNDA